MEKTVTAQSRPPRGPKVHHETAHYRVVSGLMTGPADLPEEMRLKYLVQHKTDGVIYGVSGGLGAAIIACYMAEKELSDAADVVAEDTSRQPAGGNGATGLFS